MKGDPLIQIGLSAISQLSPVLLGSVWEALPKCQRPDRSFEIVVLNVVAVGKAVIGDQVLPDGHGIPATTESLLDQCAIRLADAGGPILLGSRR